MPVVFFRRAYTSPSGAPVLRNGTGATKPSASASGNKRPMGMHSNADNAWPYARPPTERERSRDGAHSGAAVTPPLASR